MAIHCTKCGEELLGAVNRCWRCGQSYVAAPLGSPAASDSPAAVPASPGDQSAAAIAIPSPWNESAHKSRRQTTAELIEARKSSHMAMGGTVTSLLLGVLATLLACFWPPAAIIAVIGIGMGIWGLSSPRRNLALLGMLLCCLAIGIGTFGIARRVHIAIQKNRVIPIDEPSPTDN
jgi:hypothetical protein